jgi:hypothetical protein
MRMSAAARLGILMSASMAGAGVYFESTTIVVCATVAAMACVINWVRWTAPHDHWRALRRRRPHDF